MILLLPSPTTLPVSTWCWHDLYYESERLQSIAEYFHGVCKLLQDVAI